MAAGGPGKLNSYMCRFVLRREFRSLASSSQRQSYSHLLLFLNSALIPTMLDGKRTRVRAATGRSRVSRVRAATGRSRVSTSEHECRSAASGQQPLSASRRNTAHSQARAAQRRGAAADNVFEAVAHRVQFTNHPKFLTFSSRSLRKSCHGRGWAGQAEFLHVQVCFET